MRSGPRWWTGDRPATPPPKSPPSSVCRAAVRTRWLRACGALDRQPADAGGAHELPGELDQVDGAGAEDAPVLDLAQQDRVGIDGDLDHVAGPDAEVAPDLGWEHDAAELIDLARDAGALDHSFLY